jgi:hypothetical protein
MKMYQVSSERFGQIGEVITLEEAIKRLGEFWVWFTDEANEEEIADAVKAGNLIALDGEE